MTLLLVHGALRSRDPPDIITGRPSFSSRRPTFMSGAYETTNKYLRDGFDAWEALRDTMAAHDGSRRTATFMNAIDCVCRATEMPGLQ